MSDNEFLRRRLDAIQQELSVMRLRDEQREASFQSITQSLTRQIVDIAGTVDDHLRAFGERLDAMTTQLDRIELLLNTRA